jgi:hypothetical protein
VRRWAGLAAAVIAAMALGRVITEQVPIDQVADQPFVRAGTLGHPVHLEYADVTVTNLRVTPRLYGVDPVKAAGRFVLVDLEIRARRESTDLAGISLTDSHGRRFVPTDRGTACAVRTTAPTGLPWYAVFCFDVPRSALEGARLVVARGDYEVNGSGQRRDDQARIDLGVDGKDVGGLWDADLAYRGQLPGFDKVDTSPVKETTP